MSKKFRWIFCRWMFHSISTDLRNSIHRGRNMNIICKLPYGLMVLSAHCDHHFPCSSQECFCPKIYHFKLQIFMQTTITKVNDKMKRISKFHCIVTSICPAIIIVVSSPNLTFLIHIPPVFSLIISSTQFGNIFKYLRSSSVIHSLSKFLPNK